MPKTISFEMTWTTAAQIIAAALENGTDTGRAAARDELFRMALVADSKAAPRTRWDVIASNPETSSPALGVTLESSAEALAYTEALDAKGYAVDAPLEIETSTVGEALQIAAEHFADARLTDIARPADTPDRYRIATETSGGTVLFRSARHADANGWTDRLDDAASFPTAADAGACLAAIEASRPRAGRRFILAEIDTPDGPAHRELTE